jgi:ferredoxin
VPAGARAVDGQGRRPGPRCPIPKRPWRPAHNRWQPGPDGLGVRMVMYVISERCTGCGACQEVCPEDAIQVVDGVARIAQDRCTDCHACMRVCPTGAIAVAREPERAVVPHSAAVPARPSTASIVARRALPWLGMAVTFLGREILVPALTARLADSGRSRALQPMDGGSTRLRLLPGAGGRRRWARRRLGRRRRSAG